MNKKINRILKDAETFTLMEQLELLEQIIFLIKKKGKENKWEDIYGMGSGIREGIDAQDYINQLREERI